MGRSALAASALSLALIASGCSSGDDDALGGEITNLDGDATLSELDPLFDGYPGNDKLASEGKADGVYPSKFTDLVAFQSAVKSQGRRGVCSIFAATALMEHLYLKEGTMSAPDFSEQFLQWSVKEEVGSFRDTEGSNANSNLKAIHDYGIVTESDWPYESSGWGSSNDAECTGDSMPTKCYTNGSPPDSAMSATRWHLPRGRWISSRAESIKAHMATEQQAVVVGLTFFYQAWNHRGSSLSTNNAYWRKGYVTYPNDEDKEKSLEHRAGHGFLLVGWDDELEVQKRDGAGNMLTDADGNPDMEKGFFIFKNSWGTGSFGVENPNGDGFGYISMKYVEEYASAYVSDVPEVDVQEICNDGKDNDFDGLADCDDSDCSDDIACTAGSTVYSNDQQQSIPDNDASGIVSEIEVTEGGTISALSVAVDITHSYRGDLLVKLVKGSQEVVLHDHQGGGEDNLVQTFAVSDFNGEDAAGTWQLVVIDSANLDTGTLNSWSLEINTGGESTTSTYSNDEDVAIPDNDPTGAFSNIEVGDSGAIEALKVIVNIEHTYQGDLTVKLQRVGMPGEVVLQQADASSGPFESKSYVVSDYNEQDAAGTWRLTVVDEAQSDIGTLLGWSMEITF